ncbi:MAG: acylneuraminate cytidylyltransferase family protein [Bacteroidetes bacterium]|jgi:CMP-N,N'-diacetyllegionaminic acid synthase|nr:MAG: acylneuraminate cytidylyltransferase family protein [Bacteroidota bacterium]
MKFVSIILARGGSVGIPKKNLIDLNGKPLIHYTANASLASQVSETWVSSNCIEILEEAIKLGCSTISRPDHISKSDSKSEDALLHFAQHVDFDGLVFIQPTSPLLKSEDINSALEMMNDYDSVFSAYKEHWIPEWNLNNTPKDWDFHNRPMRQDVPETYVENGAFYITTKKQLLASKLRYSGNIGIFNMPKIRSFQIDTKEDLEIVSKLC